jgi:ABC-2 type transport system permease protein
MSEALAVAGAVARRTWIGIWRRPIVLAFSLGQPLLWMLFFGFLFARYQVTEPGQGLSYLDFLAPGASVMTVLFGASQAGIGWIRDLQTGWLPRMLHTAASPAAILAGKVMADVARLLLQAAAVLGLGLALGARLTCAPAALAAGVLALALFAAAFCCLSCAVALRARAQEGLATFIHLVNLPMLFTSTALVPRRQMPGWLAALSRANPLSLAADAWRSALLPGQAPHPAGTLISLAVLAALAVVLFGIARAQLPAVVSRY